MGGIFPGDQTGWVGRESSAATWNAGSSGQAPSFLRPQRLTKASAAHAAIGYWETVCTTLLTGRVLAAGSFISFKTASSYSDKVCSGAFGFICTTL